MGTTNDALMSGAQKLQNAAVRVAIGGVKKYDHVSPFYKEQYSRFYEGFIQNSFYHYVTGKPSPVASQDTGTGCLYRASTHSLLIGALSYWEPQCGTLSRSPSHRTHLYPLSLTQDTSIISFEAGL